LSIEASAKAGQTLIICPTKLHLEKIYSYLLNFYKKENISIITGYTHLNKTEHNKIWHNIKDNKIKDIGFQTFGCPAAIASSDVVCELAKGKTLEQAKKIKNKT